MSRPMSSRVTICIFGIIALSMVGCAHAPKVKVWRPWTRILTSETSVAPGPVKIKVSGATEPLVGDESLLHAELHTSLATLLGRRGFTATTDSTWTYSVVLSYRIQRHDAAESAHYNYVNTSMFSGYGSGTDLGLGAFFAAFYAATQQASTAVVASRMSVTEMYTHVFSLTISSKDGDILWSAQSTWDNPSPDARVTANPVLQLLVSSLPVIPDRWPRVPKIKAGAELNYYRVECEGHWFTSPALPYRAWFRGDDSKAGKMPRRIDNREALAAYVDLLRSAEYAVPFGGTSYTDPLKKSLWKKARLGGRYYLGSSAESTPIIVALRGSDEGYRVASCKIATEQEYKEFTTRLAKWQKALREFYDVYEQ